MSTPTSPWGKVPQQQPASFDDVMSEELVKNFENEDLLSSSLMPIDGTKSVENSPPNTDSDLMLARLLQEQFDREEVENQNRMEALDLKGGEKERKLKDGESVEGDNEGESSDSDDEQDVDRFATQERTNQAIGFRGFSRSNNGAIITKHDAEICGRRHARKVMELTSSIATGDGAGFDMKLNNSVYNSLKVHSKMEERRAARLHDKKEKATSEQTMDMNTRILIQKLINREILDEVNGCISTGKESTVYHAVGGCNEEFNIPKECALKIFKTTLTDFKNRSEYMKDDFRFKDRIGKLNHRKTINVWAEKELFNLQKIHRAGINCPQAVILKKHVLVMSFIGIQGVPAPKLREANFNPEKAKEAYQQCKEIMCTLYTNCKLVHADFSEYNLLWFLEKVWVIDVSQAVDKFHPQALEFLLRDCTNITEFFRRSGVEVPDAKLLFQEVSGLELPGEGAELLSQIRNFNREADMLKRDNDSFYDQNDKFEVMFHHSTQLLEVSEN